MISTRALAFRGLADGLRGAVAGARNLRERRFDEQQQEERMALQKAQQEAFLENMRSQNERAAQAQDFTMAREGFATRRTPQADAMIGAGERGAQQLGAGVGGMVGMAAQGAGAATGAIQRRQLDQGGLTRVGPSQREQEQRTLFDRQDALTRQSQQQLTAQQQEMADLLNRGLSGDQEARAAVLARQPQLRTLFEPQAPVMGSPEWQQAQRFLTNEQIRSNQATAAARAANDPGPNLRTIPAGVVSNISTNQRQLSVIEEAMRELERNPQAVGPRNAFIPDVLQDNMPGARFRGGVAARAPIADIGSMEIRDRSGAAVTASEFPRLRPFIPSQNDPPDVVKMKLERMRRVIAEETDLMRQYYSPEQGYAPLPGVMGPVGGGGSRGGQAATIEQVEAAQRDPEYAEYLRSMGVIVP